MPVVISNSGNVNNATANQVNPSSQPKTTQLNLRQLVGTVLQWNPDVPFEMAIRWINDGYRKVVDTRNWYGLMVKGQVTVPSVYTTGTVTVTNGSAVVTGSGTVWTNSMVGQQFRTGFTSGYYTILSVQSATQLTLDMPWGNATQSSAGYQILTAIVSMGYNIKFVLEMVNQRQGFRLILNVPQAVLNHADTWRTTTGWTYMLANREPSAAGEPQFELYPSPTYQQAFPFLAYTQPPDMVQDTDFPVLFIRSDVIVLPAIANALLFRKNTKYYDPTTAAAKLREFAVEVDNMMRADDNSYMKDMLWDFKKFPLARMGALFAQTHDMDD